MKRLSLFLTASLCLFALSTAQASIEIKGMTTGTSPVSHECPDPITHLCVDSLKPNPIERITGPSTAAQSALATYFPGWTVTYNYTQPWNGILNITSYAARDFRVDPTHPGCEVKRLPSGAFKNGMGAELVAAYAPHVDDPNDPDDPPSDDITRFRWLQVITHDDNPNVPATPYVDPPVPDDDLPFYWTQAEIAGGQDTLAFKDYPRDTCPCLGTLGVVFELYLVDWYGAEADKKIFLHEGIRWGFEINCVPEPSTFIIWSLLGALAVTVGWRRRRRAA